MKNLIWFALLGVFFTTRFPAVAQSENERLDLPGDNLNLYAVLRLFQSSPSLESFETALNDKNSEVNNLDLNGDGNVDYIRVFDNISGKLHTITLKIAVSENDEQDIAVIFAEKKDDGKVLVQLVGDEELYGKDYIIEPYTPAPATAKSDNPGYISTGNQPSLSENGGSTTVAAWPIVKYIFLPSYAVWRSPWRWNYYPPSWRTWRPQYWHAYYGYHYHWQNYYTQHYRRWKYFRNPAWYGHYNGGNIRSRSIIVRTRKGRGDYKSTYSQPASAREGSLLFKRKNAKAPGATLDAPAFDNAGRPVAVKKPAPKPVETKKKVVAKKKKKTTKSSGTRSSRSRNSSQRKAQNPS